MSVSAATLQQRWEETQGNDPIFAAFDGSNCPSLPQEARSSHSLLLERGLFRIPLPWPPLTATPEIQIEVVGDPTGCNTSKVYGIHSAKPAVSVFRRPRVAANLEPSMTLMADGREPSLKSQAIGAVLGHEQSQDHPSLDQLEKIISFETQIYVAQRSDVRGGLFGEQLGPPALGPRHLADGTAGAIGLTPANPVFLSFDSWKREPADHGLPTQFRASVARGSEVFVARCARCHSAGRQRWMNIGTTEDDAPELPLFRVTCIATGKITLTHDPGRALISGKCEDVGAIVLQQFRGLAARAPYFANGTAQTLEDVVDYYDRHYHFKLSQGQKQDLVNFLRVL
jgi:hypothetical protein